MVCGEGKNQQVWCFRIHICITITIVSMPKLSFSWKFQEKLVKSKQLEYITITCLFVHLNTRINLYKGYKSNNLILNESFVTLLSLGIGSPLNISQKYPIIKVYFHVYWFDTRYHKTGHGRFIFCDYTISQDIKSWIYRTQNKESVACINRSKIYK